MESNVLRRIFFDEEEHWSKFVARNGKRIRPIVLKEVDKFRHCGDLRRGFKLLVCEGCHEVKRVAYRCKSRFCTTCSCGESEEWSRILSQEAYQVIHRHVIFTIDEELRLVFAKHRELLKDLMDSAAKLIGDYFERHYKVTAGIIAGLHTFGGRAQFNPHVHMMVTMGGMKVDGEWKTYDFIPFAMLRKQWQTVVLKLLRQKLSATEKRRIQPLLQRAWKEHEQGFYIYAPKQKGNVKEQLRYIGRYMRRPAIGMNRIVSYDGKYVTIRYVDKKDGQEKLETMPAEELIGRLVQHIPEEQFKVIRHYGVYARRIRRVCRKLVTRWQQRVRRWIVQAKRLVRRTWSERRMEQTGRDPRVCGRCGNLFEYKGEVCLRDGRLAVKYAVEKTARECMERMIGYLTGNAKEKETARSTHTTPGQTHPVCLFAV